MINNLIQQYFYGNSLSFLGGGGPFIKIKLILNGKYNTENTNLIFLHLQRLIYILVMNEHHGNR